MITFRESAKTQAAIREMEQIVTRLRQPPAAKLEPIKRSIRAGFAENFETESAGGIPWQPLSPATVVDRIRHGFPGSHPILQRTGGYRASFTDGNNADHIGTTEQTDGRTVLAEGSDDFRVPFHEQGGAIIPQRRVLVMSTSAQDHINRELADMVTDILHGR